MERSQDNGSDNVGIRKFHDKPIRGLSIAIIILGVFSIGIGIAILTIALLTTCYYEETHHYHYDYYGTTEAPTYWPRRCDYGNTYASAGIWSGMAFIASGIIGLYSAKRKTNCFIVTMMIMSIVTAWFAACSITISVVSQGDSDQTSKESDIYSYPLSLRILDGCITLISVAVFIMSWVEFGFACHGVCCNGKHAYPTVKHGFKGYQPVQSQPVMYANTDPSSAIPSASGMHFSSPVPAPAVEPIYLVQGRQIIGVLPQNVGQNQVQVPQNFSNTSAGIDVSVQQVNPSTQQVTA